MAEVYSLQATVRSERACLNLLKAKTSDMSPRPNLPPTLKIESYKNTLSCTYVNNINFSLVFVLWLGKVAKLLNS